MFDSAAGKALDFMNSRLPLPMRAPSAFISAGDPIAKKQASVTAAAVVRSKLQQN